MEGVGSGVLVEVEQQVAAGGQDDPRGDHGLVRLGEIVGAVVYLKPSEIVEPTALIDFTRDHLAGFKVPAKLWISPEPLPKLGSAKIDKVSLRKHYRDVFAAREAAE